MSETHYLVLPDQATLAYQISEGERPLLLIHGNTGTAQTNMGMLIPQLAQNHCIIAPDLRGYGASQPPARDYPPDFYQRDTEDMAALLQHLNVGPVVVLGFSDGSESAILLAASHPELVRGVIGWGVSGVISAEIVEMVQTRLPVPDKPHWTQWQQQLAERHGAYQVQSMIEGWINAAKIIAENGGDISYEAAVQVQCPTLLINGDSDVGNTVADVTRLAERLPHCQLEIVDNCGHAIQNDQPDILMQLVTDFLHELDA